MTAPWTTPQQPQTDDPTWRMVEEARRLSGAPADPARRQAFTTLLTNLSTTLQQAHAWRTLTPQQREHTRARLVTQEATRAGVPANLALALTRVENWSAAPWAVGVHGEVGLFQINPFVHAPASIHRTTQTTALSDPAANARFGLALLKTQRARHGTWGQAVMAYNGAPNTPATERYARLVAAQLAKDANRPDILEALTQGRITALAVIDALTAPSP